MAARPAVRTPSSISRRTKRLATAACALSLLSLACGAPEASPGAARDASTAAASTVTAAPLPQTTAPAPAVTAVPGAPAVPAASSTASTIPASAIPTYKGIPVSRTPDGFFALGNPDAPITLTDYSDFL